MISIRFKHGLFLAGLVYCVAAIASMAATNLTLEITSQLHPSFAPAAGGGGDSGLPIISSDGRFVLFASTANNLTLTTSNTPIPVLVPASLNVYLRDRASNVTTLVSVNLSGTGGGNGDSLPSAVSSNGQFVLFESAAADLVPNDTNSASDVFVRDVINGITFLASVNTNGVSGNRGSRSSVMTPDGLNVAFVSAATDLVPNDTNKIADVFVWNLTSNLTTLASVGAVSTNSFGSSFSDSPAISHDGRYVAFLSTATNLIPGVQAMGDIYVRDLLSLNTYWASTNARMIALATVGSSNIVLFNLSLGAAGDYVTFEVATNSPMAYASNGIILRHNVQSGTTDLVSSNANVCPGVTDGIRSLEMSADARFIAYVGNVTNASPLVNTAVYLWDAQSGSTVLVSASQSEDLPASGICSSPAISLGGNHVAFVSSGTNLVTNYLAGDYHVYCRDIQAGTTKLADVALNGTGAGVGALIWPALSANGQWLVLETFQPNLVAMDQNSNGDVFAFNPDTAAMEWISANHPGLPGSGPTLTWPTNNWLTYQVQFKSELADPDWLEAVGSITIFGKRAHFTDLAPSTDRKFYRVVAP